MSGFLPRKEADLANRHRRGAGQAQVLCLQSCLISSCLAQETELRIRGGAAGRSVGGRHNAGAVGLMELTSAKVFHGNRSSPLPNAAPGTDLW